MVKKKTIEDQIAKDSQQLVEKLGGVINELKISIKRAMPYFEAEVESIINGGNTSSRKIERTLDELLNIVPLGYGEEQFKKLNNYYRTINPEAASDYEGYYQEEIRED